jgi:DNA-directed RNA polymerase specialized sigma24 family protein
MQEKHARIVQQILSALPERDRQALLRFYLRGEPAEVVCRETGLTETEFRRVKSRTKARFLSLARS